MANITIPDRPRSQPGMCPPLDQLHAFSRGELEGEALDAVCSHIADCPSCESALATLDVQDDVIVANLRKFVDHQPWILREEYQSSEEKAKAISLVALIASPAASSEDGASKDTRDQNGPPALLGKYQLLEELGRGGMGIVYAAMHTNLKRKVAVKILRPELATDPNVQARFRRERETVGELVHSNIVSATDADEANGCHFLVMEFVDGLDLDALLRLSGPMPVAEACELIRQAAVGLQYVYEHKRVHRDLKPSNLMLSTEGVVKILDLGLAGVFSDGKPSGELTRSNLAIGTADYMAPEQWEDSRSVDIRADIYSLGCTLYKLLAGHAPFSASEFKPLQRKKYAHTHVSYPPLTLERPDAPADLCLVLDRMLEKDPAGRYATPEEVADALLPFVVGNDCRQLVSAATRRSAELEKGPKASQRSRAETVGCRLETPVQKSRAKRGGLIAAVVHKPKWLAAGVVIVVAGLTAALMLGGGRPENDDTVRQPAPKDLDPPLQPGIFYSLLKKKPTELVWRNQRRNHFQHFDEGLEELRVDAPYIGMFGLGRTERSGYVIQLRIRQIRWSVGSGGAGGAGIFFGYHSDVVGPKAKPCIKFQFLEIRSDQKGGFILARYWGILENDKDGLNLTDSRAFAQAKLDPLRDEEDNLLIVEVKQNRLSKVVWNTKLLTPLLGTEALGQVAAADFVGQFGTINRKTSSVYGNARFMQFEKE